MGSDLWGGRGVSFERREGKDNAEVASSGTGGSHRTERKTHGIESADREVKGAVGAAGAGIGDGGGNLLAVGGVGDDDRLAAVSSTLDHRSVHGDDEGRVRVDLAAGSEGSALVVEGGLARVRGSRTGSGGNIGSLMQEKRKSAAAPLFSSKRRQDSRASRRPARQRPCRRRLCRRRPCRRQPYPRQP